MKQTNFWRWPQFDSKVTSTPRSYRSRVGTRDPRCPVTYRPQLESLTGKEEEEGRKGEGETSLTWNHTPNHPSPGDRTLSPVATRSYRPSVYKSLLTCLCIYVFFITLGLKNDSLLSQCLYTSPFWFYLDHFNLTTTFVILEYQKLSTYLCLYSCLYLLIYVDMYIHMS